MPFTKIVPADLQGKGVIGQPAVPGLSVSKMQESVEQIVREVAIPAVNRLVDELGATSASGNIGMTVPSGMAPETPETVQGVVQSHVENSENPHDVTAEQVGAYTKAETDQAIDKKVQEIGAADMAKAEFATSGEYGVVDKAKVAEASNDGTKVYTHAKSGTVHEFTGDGAVGRALMTADVVAGDTFTVNGSPVDAYLGPDPAADAMAGSEWNGKWVSFVFDGTTINFKGGGGLSAADKAKLIPENLRDGVTLFEGTPREVTGTLKLNIVDEDVSSQVTGKWNPTIDVKGFLPNYQSLTAANFSAKYVGIRGSTESRRGFQISSYDAENGLLYVITGGADMYYSELIIRCCFI